MSQIAIDNGDRVFVCVKYGYQVVKGSKILENECRISTANTETAIDDAIAYMRSTKKHLHYMRIVEARIEER
jgi:hypothetical protein